jgi:hypothetical protein
MTQWQTIVLAYLGSLCTKFHAVGWTCWFLRPFIWSGITGLMRFWDASDSECASNFVQISEKMRRRTWQWLSKCSWKKTWTVHDCLNKTKLRGLSPLANYTDRVTAPVGEVNAKFCGSRVPRGQLDGSLRPYSRFSIPVSVWIACSNSPRPRTARQVNSKVKRMLIICFGIKGIVHKRSVLARQAVNFAYYCDILLRLRENLRRLRPELWRQINWLFHHDFLFNPTNLTRNKHDCHLHLP